MAHPRRGGAEFRPRFTLTILYFGAFFLLYCAAIEAPTLHAVWTSTPPGPERDAAGFDAVRAHLRPRLPIVLVAALATTGLGGAARVLPGLRDRNRG